STWRPGWAEYAGDCQVLVTLRYDNGVRVQCEGAKAVAATSNCWGQEYIWGECELSTVVMDHRTVTRFPYSADSPVEVVAGAGEVISRAVDPHTHRRTYLDYGHVKFLQEFIAWLDGGEPMLTEVHANLRSLAIVFAGIESSRTGRAVDNHSP